MVSQWRIQPLAVMSSNTKMKKIEDVRRENLQRLRDELGSVQALADRIGKSQSQLSQWLNASAHSTSGKPRTISSGSCREVEKALGRAEGWMDVEHHEIAVVETSDAVVLRRMLNDASAEVRLLSVYRLANAAQREVIDGAVRLVIEGLDIVALLRERK
jgi:transcriptional regulator with XRE-family HTH domain